jgi:hypothetical protein
VSDVVKITKKQYVMIRSAGFDLAGDGEPAIICTKNPLETYACPDWESIVHYVINYKMCECGEHDYESALWWGEMNSS